MRAYRIEENTHVIFSTKVNDSESSFVGRDARVSMEVPIQSCVENLAKCQNSEKRLVLFFSPTIARSALPTIFSCSRSKIKMQMLKNRNSEIFENTSG